LLFLTYRKLAGTPVKDEKPLEEARSPASVNGQAISSKDFAAALQEVQLDIDLAAYEIKRSALQNLIDQKLVEEAASRNEQTVEEFVDN
jgi:hypothetical protein